jgi:hypothetical protein
MMPPDMTRDDELVINPCSGRMEPAFRHQLGRTRRHHAHTLLDLGGAVAVKLRMGDPLLTHVLFGVHICVLVWGGLYLRDAKLHQILLLRSEMRDQTAPAA